MILCLSSCNKKLDKIQRTVTYQEKVDSVDTSKICGDKENKFRSNSYNIITKARRIQSISKSKNVNRIKIIPKDVVDLNDYLSEPGDGTDWNYTEIDDEQKSHLDSLGIYWDSKTGYWRKRK
jgi:hypothetical protein